MAGLMNKLQKMWNSPDDEYEYDDYPEEEPSEPQDDEPQLTFGSREEPRRSTVSSFYYFKS